MTGNRTQLFNAQKTADCINICLTATGLEFNKIKIGNGCFLTFPKIFKNVIYQNTSAWLLESGNLTNPKDTIHLAFNKNTFSAYWISKIYISL